MLELKQVNKIFPGVHALKDVNMTVNSHEIVGLVGENGAGKSTLVKIIYGAYRHDSGKINMNGREVTFSNPRQAMNMGIGMVFQEQSLISNLTLMENIFLGFEQQFVRFGIVNHGAMARAAEKQLKKVKLDIDPRTVTSELSFVQRQLVELAKVLTLEERVNGDLVILLDEPTSVLSGEEIELLFGLVRELRTRASFIFISHRLDEVMNISDRIYILKDGAMVDCVPSENADVEDIQHKMVGREISKGFYSEDKKTDYRKDQVLLELDQLSMKKRYRDVSLKLHAGEVLSISGTEGCGAEEVLRTVFGLEKADSGKLKIGGREIKKSSPGEGIKNGVGYIPRERRIEGIVGGMNVYENITLPCIDDYVKAGILNIGTERKLARDWIKKLSIKAVSENADCEDLSGGNQQKVVLAKWRNAGAKIILLDHPTRGLDIGAKRDVYQLIREISAAGIGVMMVADTLEEAIGLSHTIITFKDGAITKVFDCAEKTPEPYDLLHHMI